MDKLSADPSAENALTYWAEDRPGQLLFNFHNRPQLHILDFV
jgi:hypothetical protein